MIGRAILVLPIRACKTGAAQSTDGSCRSIRKYRLAKVTSRTGIFCPPSRDWPPLQAYSLLPHAIGPRYGRTSSEACG
eukprot:512590-Pyramimonas_sp.AAC.1